MELAGTLPGGYWDASGTLHRDYQLEMLSGREEELLTTNGAQTASQVTTVLARCLRRLGTISPVPEDLTSRLLVGDRQYLLLHLRQAAFGDRVRAELVCPWPDCGKPVGVSFSTARFRSRSPRTRARLHPAADVGGDGRGRAARAVRRFSAAHWRRPGGALTAPGRERGGGADRAARGCVIRVGPNGDASELSPLARQEIEREMEPVAPRVDLTMEATCPECGRDVQRAVRPTALLLRRVQPDAGPPLPRGALPRLPLPLEREPRSWR